MGLIYDPFLGRIRYTWSPGAGIDMSGGTISVITPPDGVPYVAGPGIGIYGATIYGDYQAGFRISLDGATVGQQRYFPIETVSGSTVTLQAGHAYKVYATSVQVTLASELVPFEQIGMDGYLELFVASTGYVQAVPGVVLATPVEPDSVNNCRLEFRDGLCTVTVENHIAGYIVVSATGTASGTLPYALSSASQEYVAFDASLNGQTIDMGSAVTNGEKHVVGNGYSDTTITGNITCTNKTTVANLGLQDVIVVGGTLTLGDVYIPNGATVAVSGGGLAVEKVVGEGESSVIDLGGTFVLMSSGHAVIDGCVISGGYNSSTNGGAFLLNGTPVFELKKAVVTSNNGAGRGAFALNQSAELYMSNTVMSGNRGVVGLEDLLVNGGCTCTLQGGCTVGNAGIGGSLVISGSNAITNVASGYTAGTVTLTSGATLDLTGNTNPTPIAPGGGVTFAPGGATVYPSAGQASAYMLGGMTVPQIGNTNVIDLGGSSLVIDSGGTAYVSGCTLKNAGGAFLFNLDNYQTVNMESCTITDNHVSSAGLFYVNKGTVNFSGCVISGNTAAGVPGFMFAGSNCSCYFKDCSFYDKSRGFNNAFVSLSGSNTFYAPLDYNDSIAGMSGATINITSNSFLKLQNGAYVYGVISIESGAIIDLTGNTIPAPLGNRGGITIPAGAVVTVLGSGGSSGYFSELAVTGSTITNAGLIYGATVTVPASGGPWEVETTEGNSTLGADGTERQVVISGGVSYIGGL